MAARGEGASVRAHRRAGAVRVAAAVLTVSDTRTPETDTGGDLVAELLEGAGHPVVSRALVRDEREAIAAAVESAIARDDVEAVIATGGTGVSPRDVTPEAIAPLLERTLPGFGELFRVLSYEEVGAAALLSRATCGLARGRPVFALPGSRAAVRLAMERLVLPELGHLIAQAGRRGP